MTRGQMEAAVTAALTKFEREYLGRGPRQAQSFILNDLVVIRMMGVLSQAETELSTDSDGVELIKRMRSRLIENSSARLHEVVEEVVGVPVLTMHTDISVKTGERVFVFVLAEDIEPRFDDAKIGGT